MYQAMPASPMYRAEHESFRNPVRRYVEKELLPHVDAWDEEEGSPRSVYRGAGELGLLGMRGTRLERIYRDVKVYMIGGGAEEILNDLAARQLGWV